MDIEQRDDEAEGGHTVGRVAELSGVTVRTLHHYDEIGLLVPGARTEAGYRLYLEADLDRLHRILAYRALGLPLEDIAALLDENGGGEGDDLDQLSRQHRLLGEQIGRLEQMAAALELEIEARRAGIRLTATERFEVFGDFDATAHAAEAEERWGDSEAFEQSRRRTTRYSKADWQRIKSEMGDLEQRFAEAMASGEPAGGPAATALVAEHRAQIDRNFYDCSVEMHRNLTRMYIEDARFTAHFDEVAPGLAAYIHEAALAAG